MVQEIMYSIWLYFEGLIVGSVGNIGKVEFLKQF